jgi:uncharacterized protein
MPHITLSAIAIYPVKSLAGIQLTDCPVVSTGFKYDRRWMLIDREGIFLSQRRLPKMALIQPRLTAEEMVLSAPGMNELALALEPEPGAITPSTVWHDRLNLWSVSKEADDWFTRFLNTDCRLVYQPESAVRAVDPAHARSGDLTSLSDGFPFLLVSESSLAALNHAMQADLPMSRFRPNLVVAGLEAYEEDTWREIMIGSIGFRLPKPCSRCSVPTIDPDTGETGKEPLTTLNRLRKWENRVYFGQNAIHDQCGVLSVGDTVVVGKTGLHQPPLRMHQK